ncbi:MAG TPA: YebC/PmpR family DNA-binding transcriptional regulator [Kiritimatiellia bacterium]|nr:YebC/PmpR family DNA-binding transcriptional regulator [Kiritimatiellia bacterium]
MSGHNKWSSIKHKKGAADAKRGKVFSKIAKEIMVTVRTGGADPNANITLRALIQKGRAANMPSDNIERAIKRGSGDIEGEVLEEVTFEGYAPGGVGLVVQTLTNNRNRSAADVRHVFTRHGASFAGQGSVLRSFQRKGEILIDASKIEEDKLMELVLEAGAEDMVREGDQFQITTDPSSFMSVVDALNKAEIPMEKSEVSLMPDVLVPINDKTKADAIIRFIEELEELEDVQNVYSNFDIDPSIADQMGK